MRCLSWFGHAFSLVCVLLFVLAWPAAKLTTPAPSYLLLDRHQQFLAQLSSNNAPGYGYWPLAALPSRVAAATLALEDQRFWQHPGVDVWAIGRALGQNLHSGTRVSGASTVAMQVARMQTGRSRTYLNKAIDAVSALIMTYRYGRPALLKHYLRLVPYGNEIHGIAYAARQYFNKPVEDLSWAEIALLSAIPQAPTLMNPYQRAGLRRAKTRGARALQQLFEKSVINAAEYALAQQHLADLRIPPKPTRPDAALHAILQLEAQLKRQPHQHPIVIAALDLTLQNTLQSLAQGYLKKWQAHAAEQVSVIVSTNTNHQILAWLGSSAYHSRHGAIDFTQVKRSPGSTLKPFLYAQALARGNIQPNTLLDDLQSVAWGFNNADRRFLGPLLPRQALANSRNIPAINLLRATGIEAHYEFLHQLGLHQHQHPALYYGLGLALGNLSVTLADLTQAYHLFTGDGASAPLNWFRDHIPPTQTVLPAAIARQITLFLSDPIARLPSFKRMGATEYPFPVAIKTGTSQNFRDAWSMAWSKEYLVSVWVGRADARPMKRFGGANAAILAQAILFKLHPQAVQGLKDVSFPPPAGYVSREICALDGKFSRDCHRTFVEWFPAAQAPTLDSSFHHYSIDSRNQKLATQWTPKAYRKTVLHLKLPPRYRNWIIANRLPAIPTEFSPLDLPEAVTLRTRPTPPSIQHAPTATPTPIQLKIQSPTANSHIFLSPDTPPDIQTLALKVQLIQGTEHPIDQVLWYVDGEPFQLTSAPYVVRWPLLKGQHTFQAKIPYHPVVSDIVRIHVGE